MELVAAIGLCTVLCGGGVWLAVSRGTALRERDAALFKASGLADERDIATRKMAAQSSTIIKLERLVIAGGGDSRNLLSVLSEHRRLLSEADRSDPAHPDLLRPDEATPPATPAARMRAGEGLLEPADGDGGGAVDDPRSALGRRGDDVS